MGWSTQKGYSIRKGNAPKTKKWSKQKKATVALSALATMGLVAYFMMPSFEYVTGPITFNSINHTGALTNPGYTQVDGTGAAQLTVNGTATLEAQNPSGNGVNSSGSYLYTGQTSMSGGDYNPGFVNAILNNYGWTYSIQGNPPSAHKPTTLNQTSDLCGVKIAQSPSSYANNFYPDGTALTTNAIALPHITTPLLDSSYQGSQVSTVSAGNSYYLNPSMFTAYGSNGGGVYGQNYFAAYWVPVVNGTPDTSAATYAFSENDNGTKTVYDWPSVSTVISSGGMSSASGYGSGFFNDMIRRLRILVCLNKPVPHHHPYPSAAMAHHKRSTYPIQTAIA